MGVGLLLLFSCRLFLVARTFFFVAGAFIFWAGAGGVLIGARAFLTGFAGKRSGSGQNGHSGESEEEFFHDGYFVWDTIRGMQTGYIPS